MAKSIEPEVKDWFAQALSQHKTKYCIEQGTLNVEIENALKAAPSKNGGNGYGRPDFQLMVKDPTTLKCIPVMVEAKGTKGKLLKLTKLGEVELETMYPKDSKEGAANPHKAGDPCYTTIQSYAVNGAVFYARNIIEYSDSYNAVIAVGTYQEVLVEPKLYIVNLFGQDGYGRGKKQTNYAALATALFSFFRDCAQKNQSAIIRLPYGLGCGLAGGDWDMVFAIINDAAKAWNLNVEIWELQQ